MKQILQNVRDGETQLAEVPAPLVSSSGLLIRSERSLVSIGTEKMLIDFGRAGWLGKIRQQPDKVSQVWDKVRSDGLVATAEAVNAKLDKLIPLGYANVGRVLEVGDRVTGFQVGDRVVSNGPHAEVVSVPKNLCAQVPDGVAVDDAVFTVVSAIGLQGIRLLKPTLGEVFAVTGLGLIGLLAVQLLRAQGCRVVGIDFDSHRCALARQFGAEVVDLSQGQDPIQEAARISQGAGLDGVLITASTASNEPVHQGAQICRKRGRIVLVGVTGLTLNRADFYEKELSFQVSCSYGPGRYDPNYEELGQDYPRGFVRWTEQRNFSAVLDLMAAGKLDLGPLVSHRSTIDNALGAYRQIDAKETLGIVLDYRQKESSGQSTVSTQPPARTVSIEPATAEARAAKRPCVGVLGAGGFAGKVLVPALADAGVRLRTIVSAKGVSGSQLARRFSFERSSTDPQSVLADPDIDLVIIATRHHTHARYVCESLEAGKRVFVEKPLCLNSGELEEITSCYQSLLEAGRSPFVMVGFNRRFSPQVMKMKERLRRVKDPKAVTMVVNAGAVPTGHWTLDPKVGGGRIVGEACHFIDLSRFLVGEPMARIERAVCKCPEETGGQDESVSIIMSFADGSTAVVQYLTNGHRMIPKERLEVFCGGRVFQLDNFRKLRACGWSGFRRLNLWAQDKGHKAEMKALVAAAREGQASPIPFEEIIEVTRASFQVAGSGSEVC